MQLLHVHKIVPILVFITVTTALLVAMAETIPASDEAQIPLKSNEQQKHDTHFNFEAPRAYFLPSLEETNPVTFNPTTTNFGLISQPYDSDVSIPEIRDEFGSIVKPSDWQRFAHHVETLNTNSPSTTSYHVLYLARHGQGYHNLAESYYGTQPWDCYWSELDGDPNSTITWSDAHLSKLGQHQAREQNGFWRTQLQDQKMPRPQVRFVSPMERACKTLELTFHGLDPHPVPGRPFAIVKEFLRETNGIHTCDRRSPKHIIQNNYPKYRIEEGFTEQDELWDPIYRETDQAHTYRASLALDEILSSLLQNPDLSILDPKQIKGKGRYISITAHGGMINALLRAVGHRTFQVQVGSAIAVLIKVESVDGKRPSAHFERGPTKPDCVDDPLKAGLPGYTSLKDYVDKVESSVVDG